MTRLSPPVSWSVAGPARLSCRSPPQGARRHRLTLGLTSPPTTLGALRRDPGRLRTVPCAHLPPLRHVELSQRRWDGATQHASRAGSRALTPSTGTHQSSIRGSLAPKRRGVDTRGRFIDDGGSVTAREGRTRHRVVLLAVPAPCPGCGSQGRYLRQRPSRQAPWPP